MTSLRQPSAGNCGVSRTPSRSEPRRSGSAWRSARGQATLIAVSLFPSQLSGGQQQLVGIARAIIANPTVILGDEPTGNLHSDHAREIMEPFRTLSRGGTTIVQVTHSAENATYGDRVIQFRDGWLAHE